MAIRVREAPPLRLSTVITTPSGRSYRWGEDEPRPENIPSPPQFGDSMPGGFTDSTQGLARKPGTDYSDLERLSTLQHFGPGGDLAGEYRLEKAPRTSGDQMAISPAAVGWQAALEDDKSASMVYVDIDQSHWQEMSMARKLANVGNTIGSFSSAPDTSTGTPGLFAAVSDVPMYRPVVEAYYDPGPGVTVAGVFVKPTLLSFGLPDAALSNNVGFADSDVLAGAATTDLKALNGVASYVAAATPKRWAFLGLFWNGTAGGTAGLTYGTRWEKIAVFGNHGLTHRTVAAGEPDGLYASDVIAHAVRTWAPLLNFTEGADGTIQPSALVLRQLEFRDPTTVAEIIKQANKPHLKDWAVWEDKTFYYHDRGTRGRKWRARIGPSQLEETGPDVSRLWNGVIVRFNDVDGSSKSVGPPGSNASATDAVLLDSDELNPANQLGIRRWTMLDMGIVSTTAVATEVGRRFLEETKLLDSSGQAQIVGYCEDDHGIKRPYWQLRSGDYISFPDASDTSYRRIVRTQKDHSTRTCSIDLDAPPGGMDALLERLGADLVPLGL